MKNNTHRNVLLSFGLLSGALTAEAFAQIAYAPDRNCCSGEVAFAQQQTVGPEFTLTASTSTVGESSRLSFTMLSG